MNSPSWFFEPAPLRQPGVLAADVEKRFWRSRGATLALLRLVALISGSGMLLMMIAGYRYLPTAINPDTWDLTRVDIWVGVVLVASVCLVMVAGYLHRWECYLRTFRICGGLYLAALGFHVIGQLSGGSVLEDLHLAFFVGFPAAMLLVSMPRYLAVPLAAFTVLLANASHQGLPLSMDNLIEALWGSLIILPFLLLLLSAVNTTEQIDGEARRRHGSALRLARSRSLLDAESRFLGYLHDQVLHHLDGVRRGLIAPEPLPVTFPADFVDVAKPLPVRLERSVRDLVVALNQLDPDLQVKINDDFTDTCIVPAEAMSLISDAAVEALDNSMKHASQAARSVEIRVETDEEPECRSLTVILRDEGPGFCPYDVPAERAGVRVSILGRMHSRPTLSAEIDSAPGEGTTVFLAWRRPEEQEESAPCSETEDIIEDVFEMDMVLNPAFGVFAFLVIMLMGLGHPRSDWVGFTLAMALLGLAMIELLRGDKNRLPLRNTLSVSLCLIGFICLVAYERIELSVWWPPVWYTSVFAFMCVLLAMRNRTMVSSAILIIGMFSVGFLEREPEIRVHLSWDMLTGAIALILLGTIIPMALRRMLKTLNANLVEDFEKEADLVVASTRRSYIRDSASWLEKQLGAVLNPEFPEEERIFRANLLELRLRDAVRSPGFDVRATNREVWRARHRGVTVRLQDDRSDDRGIDRVPLPRTHAYLHQRLQGELRNAGVRVTARMLPLGRQIYATILTESMGEDGSVQVERIQIPTGVTSPCMAVPSGEDPVG